jgi:hypothetical protein
LPSGGGWLGGLVGEEGLAIAGEVVLEAKRSHRKENVLAVDCLALLLLALLGG